MIEKYLFVAKVMRKKTFAQEHNEHGRAHALAVYCACAYNHTEK
jgi:ribosomal 50S subunit-recycling heat shock protein